VRERLQATQQALAGEPRTAAEIAPEIYGEPLRIAADWFLAQTLCYLRHLEGQGRVRQESVDGAERRMAWGE